MAENPIVTDAGWSCTITAGSASVALIGILGPATGAAGGDFLLDAAGVPLALEAVGDTTYTLARPAAASSAGTMQLKWMRGPHRSLAALSTQKTVDVYTRQQIAMNDGRSQAVIAWQNDPPVTPAHADRYLVKVGTGAWATKDGKFAEYNTSGTPGWLFTSPRAGDRASINGSRVRLEFDGTSWGPAAVVSSATTVGRLARFTDTAGGLGQSQMAEDGSGNLTAVGTLTADGALIRARKASAGDVTLSLFQTGVRDWRLINRATFGTLAINNGTTDFVTIDPVTGATVFAGDITVSRANPRVRFSNTSGTATTLYFGADSGAAFLGTETNAPLNFYTNGTNRGGFSAAGVFSTVGNATIGGDLTVNSALYSVSLAARSGAVGVNGYMTMIAGDATSSGYAEFRHKDGTRRGYIGYASGGYINMVAEGGYQWAMNGNLGILGSLQTTGSIKVTTATQATVDIERTGGVTTALVTTAPNLDGLRITTYAQPTTFENITDYYSNGANRGAINGWHRFFATTTASAGPAFEVRHTDVRSNLKLRLTGGEGSQLEIAGAAKTWGLNVANATGEAYFQNVTDSRFPFTIDAAAPTHSLRIQSAKVTLGLPLEMKAYTLGTLPSAAANSGATVRVTDGASNKQIVTSDGSVWRYSDGVSV